MVGDAIGEQLFLKYLEIQDQGIESLIRLLADIKIMSNLQLSYQTPRQKQQ